MELRPLVRDRDLDSVFAVLADAPFFHRLTSGAPATPATAASVFDDLPPGKTLADKHVYGVVDGGEFVGVVDVIVGWPRAKTAMIGLFVLREPAQGRGLGRAAFAALRRVLVDELGCDRARIGVQAQNTGALAYWQKMGFAPTGERKPWREGSVVDEVIVCERAL